ncbi:cysteine desulfurase [Oenococcus kitaharae]|uniref:cysteine desulfurase n=1 Tax=Oenococcus kitaharae DSM 17330 TaxID=1045004 RepID=G9WF67_9LACO|nr:cysteine desulfurase [Oenococcus kitaharae]EHN58787.1 SufS subfamily cysteine desulfurase [Oenococcus kitaharae DSM 17330]OEY81869.1 cysteine desulfurase [Oenococcus kitaharae]OEY84098.1 cysteine desulfurase [Oenococcus kitaharae]OEY85542.1 cysteine desulfurase [Oenococcus kitaharae]
MDNGLNNSRNDFEFFQQLINGEKLDYLDSAATAQRPVSVLKAVSDFYRHDNANVHRSINTLSSRATDSYEAARDKVAGFIHAADSQSIVFTRSTTESLNLVARSFGDLVVTAGDEILISEMEHHSNLIPWQQLAQRKQAKLVYIGLQADGELNMTDLKRKLTSRTKIVAIAQVSNVLGTINPIKEIARLAHEQGAYMVVDGAQAAPHFAVDVQDLDADFYAFSGHKMLAPAGIGVLYGKKALLDQMPPVQFGGEMIDRVDEQSATWAAAPLKFEAGTPNIGGAIGLAAAIDYLQALGMDKIEAYEQDLMAIVLKGLSQIDGLTIYGPLDAAKHASVLAFNLGKLHAHDVATALDLQGIEVRAGDHCAQPLMHYLGISAAVRASFYFYNTRDDVDRLISGLQRTKEFFSNAAR